MRMLAEAGRENIDVSVVLVLMDLIEHDDPRPHSVFSFRVVRAALDLTAAAEILDTFRFPGKIAL